jgi:hypothetical protein
LFLNTRKPYCWSRDEDYNYMLLEELLSGENFNISELSMGSRRLNFAGKTIP